MSHQATKRGSRLVATGNQGLSCSQHPPPLRLPLNPMECEKIRQLFGGIEPEKMRESSRHEHFEGDEVALAKLVVKKREKPGKFLRPHGMILLFWAFCIFMEDNP